VDVRPSTATEYEQDEFPYTSRHRQPLPDGDFLVGANQVQLIPSARYLGVYVDGEMSLGSRMWLSHASVRCARFVPYGDRCHLPRRRR
jgi:hypothetical protein